MDSIIYHIVSNDDWNNAQKTGSYQPPSLLNEGFIHCSTRAQVLDTAERYYKGVRNLVLLCIRVVQVPVEVRFEESVGHGLFPHIYGPLPVYAVSSVVNFPVRPDGLFDWPSDALTE